MDVSIEYEKLPEIPETDFSKIKLRKLVAKVDKGSVDEALANLASSSPNFKNRPKTGKAKSGDQLLIDFSGSVDGVDFDGGKAETIRWYWVQIVLFLVLRNNWLE